MLNVLAIVELGFFFFNTNTRYVLCSNCKSKRNHI